MSINYALTTAQHPEFCDPRVCITTGPENVEHRSAGHTWTPSGADTEITVSTVAFEERGDLAALGEPMVHLSILDPCGNPDGTDAQAGTDLDPDAAELLAAELGLEAKRIRAMRARAAR